MSMIKKNSEIPSYILISQAHPLILSVSWHPFTMFSGTHQQSSISNHFMYFPLICSLNKTQCFFVDSASHASFQEIAISIPHHLNDWDWRWVNILFAPQYLFQSSLPPSYNLLVVISWHLPTILYRSLWPTSGHFPSSIKILVLAHCHSLQHHSHNIIWKFQYPSYMRLQNH